ncbi:MAG: His/Gly/Thr/Pro-type tRNA ligase C-terminal domain-containing protein [bacterium]
MPTSKDSTTLKAEDVLRRAHAVGNYYGFLPLASLTAMKRGGNTKLPFPDTLQLNSLDATAQIVATFLKQVRDGGLIPSSTQPLFVWHTNAAAGRPAPKQLLIQFHAIGADRAIADAVLIRAVRALAADIHKGELLLRINSMGDRETRNRFSRELGVFFRKRGAALPTDCVDCAKRDVFEAAELLLDSEHEGDLPTPTDHLSEASRKRFEDLLEYLEATETPYDLAPNLLSRGAAWSETCFEVRAGGHPVAWGSRYTDLTRHFFKGQVPAVGAVLKVNVQGGTTLPAAKVSGQPRFVFVHIGEEAKRASMLIADTLRHTRIPLMQSIGVESLTEQMRLAELLNPRYLLIMGRKEALDHSVTLRERSTHTETSIPVASLVERLRAVA